MGRRGIRGVYRYSDGGSRNPNADLEGGAAADFRLELDLAAVALQDLVGERETQARPASRLLGGEERIEDARRDLLRNAATVVRDLEDYERTVDARAHRNRAVAFGVRIGVAFDRMRGIHD